MKNRLHPLVLALTAFVPVAGQEQGSIGYAVNAGRLFVNGKDLASATGFEMKVIDPTKLITFCRETEQAICIPIRVSPEDVVAAKDGLLVSADLLGKSLSMKIALRGNAVSAQPMSGVERTAVDRYRYGDRWPDGRGFGIGDTVPDIPLVDMDGDEVRLSQFLGKRYILYCWASW